MDWNDPDKLVFLLTAPVPTIVKKYGYSKEYIGTLRFRKRNDLKKEGINVAEILKNPEPDKNLREALAQRVGKTATAQLVTIKVPEEHLPYHEQLQEALDEHGALNKMRVSDYQMLTKDADGEAEVHDLKAKRFEVKFDVEPLWEPLQQANPRIVRPAKYNRKTQPEGWKTAVILPDPQIYYRRYEDGSLDPVHDELALEVAMQLVAELKPELTLVLGDLMDLPEASMKYAIMPEFNQMMQPSVERAGEFLAQIRASVPDTKLVVMEGNHDRRILNSNNANLQYSLRLKQFNGDQFPVLSIPHLVNFEKLGVEYVAGYPANTYWITDRLKAVHGSKAVSRGSTASAIVADERVSTIFGHIHRQEDHKKTFDTKDGPKIYSAFSPGCLCRIDGAVPSTRGSTDLMGRPIKKYENWQNGVAVVQFNENTGQFHYQNVFINTAEGYTAYHNGKIYRPSETKS